MSDRQPSSKGGSETLACETCEAPQRDLWPQHTDAPVLPVVAGDAHGYARVSQCPACNALWFGSVYEPYCMYWYFVRWPYSLEAWERLAARDLEAELYSWHRSEIQRVGPGLTGRDAEALARHRERSYGLQPYDDRKPIDPPDIAALLADS